MLVKYLDVPLIHTNSNEGFNFMLAMKELSYNASNDLLLNIYSKRSVQIVISEHWERT